MPSAFFILVLRIWKEPVSECEARGRFTTQARIAKAGAGAQERGGLFSS